MYTDRSQDGFTVQDRPARSQLLRLHRLATIKLRRRLPVLFLCQTLSCTAIADQNGASGPVTPESREALTHLIQQMNERLDRLERRNAELEDELQTMRTETAKTQNTEQTKTTASKTQPAQTVEFQSTSVQQAARAIEFIDRLEQIESNISLTSVAQSPTGVGKNSPEEHSQLNYRADFSLGLPLPSIGKMESLLFAHFRMGQGLGLNELPVYAKPNATAFRPMSFSGSDSAAVLGQIWYQGKIPLANGIAPASTGTIEFNFGKMDPFIFFDQNAIANDEAKQFLNTVFVHNALLDAGGDIGVDENGFSPGIRISYAENGIGRNGWRFSLGLFGAGRGADFSQTFSSPLFISQAETELKLFDRPGNYRLTYWHNGQAAGYDERTYRRSGIGLSADQEIAEGLTLFTRLTQNLEKDGARFERAYSLGTEVNGGRWNRGEDALGIAFGLQHTSHAYARDSARGLIEGDPLYTYSASGYEKVAEIYYRYRLSEALELSPNFQYIRNPGGNPGQSSIAIYGLRVQVDF